MADEEAARIRNATLDEVQRLLRFAREEGDATIAQVGLWVEGLRTQTADGLLAELKDD